MDTFLYFLFSVLDTLSVMCLMFALFRFPLLDYKKEILLFTMLIALISYIIRNELLIQEIDPVIQVLLTILFFRFIVKIRLLHALSISASGYLGFVFVQIIIIGVLWLAKAIHPTDLPDVSNWNVYLIQLTTELICFLFAFLIQIFNLGFSFIPAPPHDIFIHDKMNRSNVIILTVISISLIIMFLVVYWMLNLKYSIYLYVAGIILIFAVLMYLLYRRDHS